MSRVCVGTYNLKSAKRNAKATIAVTYTTVQGTFNLSFSLLRGHSFSAQLEWEQCSLLESSGELVPFDLGREYYKDGTRVEGSPPSNPGKDHFASLDFHACDTLTHLL